MDSIITTKHNHTQRFGSTQRTWIGSKFIEYLAGFFLVFCALLLYAMTLDNGFMTRELEGGDLITHQYAQVQARPSNAPGYPLYTMGGWLWFHGGRALMQLVEPLPNPIPILSSYSTFWALISLWLLYRILCAVMQMTVMQMTVKPETERSTHWPLAWLLTAFYALTYFFWYYATTTEQYSSAVAQTLAIVYVYLLWQQEADTYANETPPPLLTKLYILAFLCGLSLAHMLTIAFIVPPLVAIILWQRPDFLRRPRVIANAIIAAAIPLVSYVYVYVRGTAHPKWWGEGDWETPQAWFWAFLSTAQGREELGWGLEPGRSFFTHEFPSLMWQELSIPFFVIGLLGIAWMGWRLGILLYGTLLIYVAFCWGYRFGNWYQVILPAYPLILMGVAAVFAKVRQSVNYPRTPPGRGDERSGIPKLLSPLPGSTYTSSILAIILIVACIWRFAASLPEADSWNRLEDVDFTRQFMLLEEPLPTNAGLFANVHDTLAMQYLIDIWQVWPHMASPSDQAMMPEVVSSIEADERLRSGYPVLSSVDMFPTLLAELPAYPALTVQSWSPDWLILQTDVEPVDPVMALGFLQQNQKSQHVITPEVTLSTYHAHVVPSTQTGRMTVLRVYLVWELANQSWPADLSISVRPMHNGAFIPASNPDDGILQQDASSPASGLLEAYGIPFVSPMVDAYGLALPEKPSGVQQVDGVMVILYRTVEGGFENVAELVLPIE
ncbi:MAG: DUF2723 domain-containing protein [Chloroflexota bacterium]